MIHLSTPRYNIKVKIDYQLNENNKDRTHVFTDTIQ